MMARIPTITMADFIRCSQCGNALSDRACGPTHAMLAADPTKHNALAPIVAAARAEGRREGAAAVREAVEGAIRNGSSFQLASRIEAALDAAAPTGGPDAS